MRCLRLSDIAALGIARTAAATFVRRAERGGSPAEAHDPPDSAAGPFLPEETTLPRMIYPGARIENRYWIEEEIGIGGLCFVHRVRDAQSGQAFALKTLQPGFSAMPFYFEMMQREAAIQSTIRHPHILACERLICADDGRRALLLPYLSGGTLSQRVDSQGPLSPEQCSKLLDTMLDVLACLRRSGITHLDIAPDNIMYSDAGSAEVRLIDFGLSRNDGGAMLQGEEDLFLGKMSWASPEMLCGRPITPDSDLYSLGLVLHFALTGERFVRGESFLEKPPGLPPRTTACERLRSSLTSLLDVVPQRRRRVYLENTTGQHAGRADRRP